MVSYIPWAVFVLFCLQHELGSTITVRKFVYKKDISEHCRRRVMPSIFLGRHVVDANSQILHFTRLELPYSCFITVRAESGMNLIVVVQMVLKNNIISSCSKNGDQLLVYEMSETFGGYWGPLSDSIIKRDRVNDTKFYTLKTTQPTEPTTLDSEEYVDYVETISKTLDSHLSTKYDNSAEYIRMELPIVNVSGKLDAGEPPRKNIYDIDDSFDFLYDVTPRRGFSYDTSIIPLVQFSIKTNSIERQGSEEESTYGIDYNLKPITPDGRLLLSTLLNRKKHKPYKYNANRRLNFKTSKLLLATYRRHFYKKKPITMTQHILTNPLNTTIQATTTENILSFKKESLGNISWEFIDDLMKMFKKTATSTSTTAKDNQQVYKNLSDNIQKGLDMRHSSSVYLSPNLSVYYKDVPLYVSIPRTPATASENALLFIEDTEMDFRHITHTLPLPRNTEKVLSDVTALSTINNSIPTSASLIEVSYNKDQYITNSNINVTTEPTATVVGSSDSSKVVSTLKSLKDENLTGSLVGRESWDNVVQVAPAMAVILHNLKHNQSQSTQINKVKSGTARKKRYIESVPIENARPHNITVKGDIVTAATVKYDVSDMQDLAQLVEIQDDELHGRVALRYLRRYVGPALLNICDYTDTATRHVYLFNSSRIVFALTNFTIDSMTVIVTPARTVMIGDDRCPEDHIECQVSGARVCIDSLTACDGIPNCGSHEIYDEDRLRCGVAMGLQHNVYLAAFTFLAVLLTVLYGVHYWLKRCVPKVSDAFFIYTDGTENVLYLDTIMRSPTDDDDAFKMDFQGNIIDDDLLLFSDVNEGHKSNMYKRFFKSLLACGVFRKKPKKKDAYDKMTQEGLYASLEEQKKRYSYAELELRKILDSEKAKKDIALQTGGSLEMICTTNLTGHITEIPKRLPHYTCNMSESLLALNENILLQEMDYPCSLAELSILNFFNNSKSDYSKSKSSDEMVQFQPLARSSITLEEKEIKIHTYDNKTKKRNIPSTSTLAYPKVLVEEPSDRTKKRLRFEETTTTIPPGLNNEDIDDNLNEIDNISRRRSVVLGVGKIQRTRNLESIEEDDENVGSVQSNTIRFWGKSKKSKK